MAGRGYLKSQMAKLAKKQSEEQPQPVELPKLPTSTVSSNDEVSKDTIAVENPRASIPRGLHNIRGRRVNIIITLKIRVLINEF